MADFLNKLKDDKGNEFDIAPDWSNVQNKPFETVGGDTLTWDGNTDGLESIDMAGDGSFMLYCVSDATPTIEDLNNGYALTYQYGNTVDTEYQGDAGAGFVMLSSTTTGVIIYENAVGVDLGGVTFPKAGVYFAKLNIGEESDYANKLTINGYTGFVAEKLKANYLPDDVCGMIVELDLSTATNNEVTVSDVNYTPFYDHYKKGGTVLIKAESDVAENYFGVSAVVKNKDDGYLYVYYFVADAMWVAVFTTP